MALLTLLAFNSVDFCSDTTHVPAAAVVVNPQSPSPSPWLSRILPLSFVHSVKWPPLLYHNHHNQDHPSNSVKKVPLRSYHLDLQSSNQMSAPWRFTWRPDCNEDGRLRRIDVNRPAATFSWRPGHVSSIQRTERHGDATLSWRVTPREAMLDSPTDEAANNAALAPRHSPALHPASPPPPSPRLALAPSSLGLGSGTSLIPQEHKRKERFFIRINWLNYYLPPPAEIRTPNVTSFIPCPFTNDLPYIAWGETKE